MYLIVMRIIARKVLRDHWEMPGRIDSEQPLKSWFAITETADWKNPAALKGTFLNASILQGCRVVFNIAGNKYRLVVKINYPYRVVYVRFVGTHAEYDRINITEV